VISWFQAFAFKSSTCTAYAEPPNSQQPQQQQQQQHMASSEEHTCAYCSTTKTVLWRRGWVEPGDATHTPVFLCNLCGLQYKQRKMPGHVPPAATFHSPAPPRVPVHHAGAAPPPPPYQSAGAVPPAYQAAANPWPNKHSGAQGRSNKKQKTKATNSANNKACGGGGGGHRTTPATPAPKPREISDPELVQGELGNPLLHSYDPNRVGAVQLLNTVDPSAW
jgi:hypothetical protein